MKKSAFFITFFAVLMCVCGVFSFAEEPTQETTAQEIIIPAKVTGVKQKSYTEDSVTLTWNKVDNAKEYIVYRYYYADKQYSEILRTKKNSVTVSGLNAAGKYAFKICACSENGIGTKSNALTVYTAPAKVTSLKASAATSTTITLTWKKVSGATGYKVYKYNSSTGKYALYKSVTANTVKVSSLKTKANYKFYVAAYKTVDSVTYTGVKSAVLLTGTSTAAPTISSVSGSTVTSAKVSFNAVSGAAGYYVQFSTSKSFTSVIKKTGTKSPITLTGLTPGKTYYVRLRTYRTVNGVKVYSPYSASKSFKNAVKGIDIVQNSKKVYTGCKVYLTSKVYPSTATLKWITSDKTVATVKAYGKTGCIVTAKKAGTVTVTSSFTYNGKTYKDTCKITVVSATKAPKYALCPQVPDFGAIYGVTGEEESADGIYAYEYMKSDILKKVTNKAEIDNYKVILEKNGFEDWSWALAFMGGAYDDILEDEGMKLVGIYANENYLVVISEATEYGVYGVAVMSIAELEKLIEEA